MILINWIGVIFKTIFTSNAAITQLNSNRQIKQAVEINFLKSRIHQEFLLTKVAKMARLKQEAGQ